jgi:HAD superfamily hydrolase (TIGR01509 family)
VLSFGHADLHPKAMSQKMLYLFDCDGVLVDSEIIAAEVDAKLFTEHGVPLTTEEVVHRYAGLALRKIVELVEKDSGRKLPDDILEQQRTILEDRLARDLKAIAGFDQILERLDGDRCVCSNSSSKRMQLTLGKTNLHDVFAPHIYSAIEVGDRSPKPSPNVFRHAAEQFGVSPRECIVIEDSLFGVTAARDAGMRVIGFTGGSHTWPGHADVLTEAGAETVIKRFADLPRIAEALMAWDWMPD